MALVDVPDGASTTTMVASPADFAGTPWAARSTAPGLGEHTAAILAELGRDDADDLADGRRVRSPSGRRTDATAMRWTELRGFLAFCAVVVAIAVAWIRIDDHGADTETEVASSTTTTTTTTVPVTTTTTAEQAVAALCTRTDDLMLEIFLSGGGDEATTARLLLQYWTDVLPLVTDDIRVEVRAVVDYYGDYLAVGEPFGFDTDEIILQGDKERWEQLITRPASGLEESRTLVAFLCGTELPEQNRMSASRFDSLEDRLLKLKP